MKTLRVLGCSIAAIAALSVFAPASASSAPKAGAKPSSTSHAAASVDLNTASEAALETLPGVGAANAKKIIAGRPYGSVADLSKAGVSAGTIKTITPHVTVGGTAAAPAAASHAAPAAAATAPATHSSHGDANPAAPAGGVVDVNNATEKELEALPGVGAATAKKIIAGRPYRTVTDLSRAGVSQKTLAQINSMVTVGPAAVAATPVAATPARSARAVVAPAIAATPQAAPQTPPPAGSGMVWVNLESKVYHYEGDRWYGTTKSGKYMPEADAMKAGYRAAKTESAKK